MKHLGILAGYIIILYLYFLSFLCPETPIGLPCLSLESQEQILVFHIGRIGGNLGIALLH